MTLAIGFRRRQTTDLTRSRPLRRLMHSRSTVIAAGFLLTVVALGLLAPLVVRGPFEQDLARTLTPPSSKHWLGTDELGRDQLSRLLNGGRVSLLASFEAVGVAVIVAVPSGLLAGYRGGWVDTLLSRLNDAIMSAPPLILAITVVAVIGPGLTTAMLAIGLIFSPTLFRIVRAASIQVRSETFIEASRAIGSGERRTIVRHVLPNILPPVIVQISLLLGTAMLAESSLSFIGLGVRPPTPSWGGMLRTAFDHIDSARYMLYPPAIVLGLTVLALAQVGDGLRRAFSIKKEAT